MSAESAEEVPAGVDPGEGGPVDPLAEWTSVEDEAAACLREYEDVCLLIRRADAARMRLLVKFAALRPPQEGEERRFADFAPEEVAVEVGLSPREAAREMKLACALADRLPATLAALEAGEIDLRRAEAMARITSSLPAEQAGEVERRVLARGGRCNRDAFAAAARRAVLVMDPEGGQRRHERRRAERHVRLIPEDDGMARLQVLLPAEEAQACSRRLDQIARHAVAGNPEDGRTLDQVRADALIDLVLGRDRGFDPLTVEIQVVVPVTTLLGMSEAPAELPGYGPIPAALARELADRPNSTWRRILTDPASGALVEVADRRFPSPGQARHVRARDRRCVFPACHQPASMCELDHTVEYVVGGRTLTTNLGSLCERHHRLKHAGAGWELEQTGDGRFTWTTPTGGRHTVEPPPYLDLHDLNDR